MINLNVSIKSPKELDQAVQEFNRIIHEAATQSTPLLPLHPNQQKYSTLIMEKIARKRSLRKRWQITKDPADKLALNRSTKEVKLLIKTSRFGK